MTGQRIFKSIDMREIKFKAIYLLIALIGISCTRDEEDLAPALFPTTPDIFTDDPVSLTDEFFVSFDPAAGANPDGFGTDDNEAFEGTSSIRIDVPSADDPNGVFIGGIFLDRGDGRNLTDYDALTFWARASTTATVGTFGFGTDFAENRYTASINDIQLSTDWRKYTVPIPDPSKLTQEKGMFLFSAGTASTNGVGYTFWIDELRFEDTGTVAQPRPAIFNGEDQVTESFTGVDIPATNLTQTFNLGDGTNQTVSASANYFNFSSSDESVLRFIEPDIIRVVGTGTATISASIAGVRAAGSLTVTASGAFLSAPVPTRSADSVVSIFSDAYTNVQVDNYNGFFEFATTQGGAINIGGENIISYTELNFVSINMFESPDVDASAATHIHVDINVRESLDAGDFLNFQIINDDGGAASSGSVSLGSYSPLIEGEWVSYDIPLADFAGLTATNDVDLIFFVSDATISDIYVDNVYFYID